MNKFLLSCCVILTLTAWAKLYSATGHAVILFSSDPLLGVSNRTVLWAAGVLELGVVAFLLLSEDNVSRCACVCWLALNFTLYRVGIFWLHPGKLCPCLGTVTDKLGLKPQTVNWMLKMVIVYMLAGSVLFLIREWQHRQFRKTLPPVK
jgi:hypothetical protein